MTRKAQREDYNTGTLNYSVTGSLAGTRAGSDGRPAI